MHVTMPELAFFFLTLPLCLWVAWTDLRFMTIHNRVNIAFFVIFAVSGLLLLPLEDFGLRIAVGGIALLVGFLLNAVRLMGGGDAKFLAATLPFIASHDLGRFAFVMSFCLLAAVVVHRVAQRIPAIRRATPEWISWSAGKRFPMGLGLATGLSGFLAIRAFNLPVAGG